MTSSSPTPDAFERILAEKSVAVEPYEYPEDNVYGLAVTAGLMSDRDFAEGLKLLAAQIAEQTDGVEPLGSGPKCGGFTVICDSAETRKVFLQRLGQCITSIYAPEPLPENRPPDQPKPGM